MDRNSIKLRPTQHRTLKRHAQNVAFVVSLVSVYVAPAAAVLVL